MKICKLPTAYVRFDKLSYWEHSGLVVECLTQDQGAGASPASLCFVLEQDKFNPSLVLVQPRKSSPYITERLLMGHKESNQKLEDLKVLRRSPDLLNDVKIGQGQLQLIMKQILFYHILGLQPFWSSDLNNPMNTPSNSPVISEEKMFR